MPIRLEVETEKLLQKYAEKFGTTKSAIIRLLAKSFVDQVVSNSGEVTMPPNWNVLLKPADGRSKIKKQVNIGVKSNFSGNQGSVVFGNQVVNHIKKNSDQSNLRSNELQSATKKAAAKNVAKVKGNGNKISQQ